MLLQFHSHRRIVIFKYIFALMYLYYGHPLPYDVATEALKFKVRHINIWLDSVLESERVLKEVVWLEVLLLS
uniref:Transmembrane protein n=1 Tax=Medicago truncatula TaxID=3880 RepID=Q2HWC0_MEDTR|nr:hypothetical protein MtrDRAFT_AC147482g11v2 [Medicago truncatula]